jgi:hypothetical protein
MLRLRTVTAGRIPAGFVAFGLAIAGLLTVAPSHAPALLAAGAPSRLALNINLASSQELSAVSTGALVAEVNAIWWNSNVSLVWRTVDVSEPLPAMPEAEDWLRVLVLARQKPGAGETSTLTVGELVRTEGTRPLAIASLTAARRIVDESIRFQLLEGPRDYDRRIGVVLGRAVAHEIGHYLLGPSHANHGLMRANIDALEFADVRSHSFLLDEPARASLVHRTSLSASSYGTR